MNRVTTLEWTTGSVTAGSFIQVNQQINAPSIDLLKIKISPNIAGGSSQAQIYSRDTFQISDLLYNTRDFSGTLIDPLEDVSDPMTDVAGATAERNEGWILPYDDEDSGSSEFHLKIFSSITRTFTVTLVYQEPVLAKNGVVSIADTLTVLGLNGVTIASPAPILDLTDTTGGSNSLRITVDNNFADFIERTGALGSLLRLDIGNNRVGIGATPSSLFEISNLILPTMTINCPLTTLGNDSSNTAYIDFKGITDPGTNNSPQIKYRIGMHQYGPQTVNFRIRDMFASPVPIDRLIVNWDGRVGNTVDNITDLISGLGVSVGPGASGFGWKIGSIGYIAAFENTNVNPNCGGVLIKTAGTAGANSLLMCTSGNHIRFLLYDDGQCALPPNAVGQNAPGRYLVIGNNNFGTEPGPGSLNLVNLSGAAGVLWVDNASVLRIWGSRPTYQTDGSGSVVGTQTSRLETKNIMQKWSDPMPALQEILKTPVFDFTYRNGAYNQSRFSGIVSEFSPRFTMDRGNSFSPVTAFGYTVEAIKALYLMIQELRDGLAAKNQTQ